MRNVSSSLVLFALAGAGVSLIIACSADGSTDIPGDTSQSTDPTLPAGDDTPNIPGSGGSSSNGKADSGAKQATDAGATAKDAGPPPPAEGSPCTVSGQEYTRSCGFCGTQSAICTTADTDGGSEAGSGLAVSTYGDCMGEVANGCTPGTTQMAACGLCGTHQEICQNSCQWAAGTCMNEPANACSPGSVINTAAGCGKDGSGNQQYRQETCDTTCKVGAPSACGVFVNPHMLTISGTAKGVVSMTVDMEVMKGQSFVVSDFAECPDNDPTDLTDDAPSDYVQVNNTTAKVATVTAYTTPATAGDTFSTNLWTYPGTVPPMTDVARLACGSGVSSFCASSTLCGPDSDEYFASLGSISIPAGGSVLIYVGSYDDSTTGQVGFNVRTDTLK